MKIIFKKIGTVILKIPPIDADMAGSKPVKIIRHVIKHGRKPAEF
jgi:hypothetical protein